jgi:hypothetical protein
MGKDNLRKGFGDFWRLKRGLTPCAILNGRVFDRETVDARPEKMSALRVSATNRWAISEIPAMST